MPDSTATGQTAAPDVSLAAADAPLPGTYVSFDFGQKRIGVAVGHSNTGSANPLAVVRNINGRPEWHAIDALIEEWQPVGLVVGQPVNEEAQDSGSARANQTHSNTQQLVLSAAFAKKIRERYSSMEAARLLAENRSRGKRKKVAREDLDKVAAAIILNQWFDNAFK
jgi:putative Holliday junction resolvase